MHRPTLGIIALALLAAGLVGSFTDVFGEDSLAVGGVLLRGGAVLGALWLVLPKARALPGSVWAGLGVFVTVLVLRPRLILFGLPLAFVAMVVVAMAQRRSATSRRR